MSKISCQLYPNEYSSKGLQSSSFKFKNSTDLVTLELLLMGLSLKEILPVAQKLSRITLKTTLTFLSSYIILVTNQNHFLNANVRIMF